ncbi:MAG: DNA polymerase sliding clamp [Methanosarcinales archaeon]|nr:DNA polymerase sliding clamp [Methanosarcinales archaeon]
MFKAIINAGTLHDAIKAMSAVVDEARFEIASEGFSARAVDPANAAMVSLDISKDAFVLFEGTDGEIGVDLGRFTEIIGMADKNDEIELALDPDTHKLDISMGGFSYTLSLLDPSTLRNAPMVPALDLPAGITVSGSVFKRMIKAAEMVSDHTSFGVHDGVFFMEATGDSDQVRLDLTSSDLIAITPADVRSLYSLDYLGDISKGVGGAGEIDIHLGRDLPVVIQFELSNGDCKVKYVLAPRIESD